MMHFSRQALDGSSPRSRALERLWLMRVLAVALLIGNRRTELSAS